MERLKNKAEILFVTGTDTGVGKSVLSLLIMQYLFAKGHTPFYLKPFQTGCKDPYDKDSDARFIYSHVAQLQDKDPADSVVYCFTNPKAPLFAARDDAREIDLAVCDMIVTRKSGLHSHLVIEGAGGLLVPVNSRTTMADLILRNRCPTNHCSTCRSGDDQSYPPDHRGHQGQGSESPGDCIPGHGARGNVA